MSMIKVEDAHKRFNDLEVLKGVNLEVEKGEVVCIVGPSGAGKSTMLRCLNHLERITSGKIYIEDKLVDHRKNNKDLLKINNKEVEKLCTELGMVFQRFNLFPHKTVLENITLAPIIVKKIPKEEAEKKAMELLELVGLEDKANEYPNRLSGGQQQRVAIARALAAQPDIIFADEPTGNLDSKSGSEVMELLKNVQRKMDKTLVVITHDNRIAKMADKQFVIVDGILSEVAA